MVCLPVSLPTNSSTTARNSASDSPDFKSASISTIMGTITSIQPARMIEMVPSKSNKTTRASRACTPGRRCSIMGSIDCGTKEDEKLNSPQALRRGEGQRKPAVCCPWISPAVLYLLTSVGVFFVGAGMCTKTSPLGGCDTIVNLLGESNTILV